MKFLIVDDEFNNRFLLQRLLSPYGHCTMVVDGQEALAAFVQAHTIREPYALICMDIMMPEMDGKEAVREIRSMEQSLGIKPRDEVKILMTTSVSATHTIIETFYQDGCTDYLVKPITQEKLLVKLRELKLIHDPD